ncbi:MAG TPA: VOC family protein [Acidimicrobiia bacterium]|jgi:catechol 2,3-dioxygenase-like lactoylglutathione lyase family enzyme|nr:VOC family protein [Acidimicrobiia bacterium]
MSNFDIPAANATVTVTLDCSDPDSLARFWSEALGYQEIARVENFVVLGPAPGVMKFALQGVPEPRPGKNRMHLDLWVADIEVEAARLEAIGAKRLQDKPLDEHGFLWYQLVDPEGNEFCIGRA